MSLADFLNWPARRPIVALSIIAAMSIASLVLVRRLQPDVSLQGIMSSNNPAATALDRVLNHFAAVEELLVLVSAQNPDQLLEYAARFELAVKNDPVASTQVAQITYRADAQTRQFVEKVIGPNGFFYLTDVEFAAAKQRLTREGIAEQFRRNEQLIATPGPAAGALSKAFMQDPLRLHEFLVSRMNSLRPFQTYQNSDAFLSADGKSLLIRVAGKKPPSDLEFAKDLTATIARLSSQINSDGLQIDISGSYPIAAHSASSIRHDTIESVITSIVSFALLFLLVYRTPLRMFLLAMAPVAIGVLFGFAAYALFRQKITPLTAVIGGMLAGIGIDYSVHYLTQYHSRRCNGLTAREAT